MIETTTTFILGSGAHAPYSFPTNTQFREQLIKVMNNDANQIGAQLGVGEGLVKEMAVSFESSVQPSIDAWLWRWEKYRALGKVCMTRRLLQIEKEWRDAISNNGAKLWGENAGWLSLLWERMTNGVQHAKEMFEKNRVRFVTFNYDRSLEFFLERAMRGTFPDYSDEIMGKTPIIHVYGQLGRLKWQQQDINEVEYGTAVDFIRAKEISSGIKVMGEERELISRAEIHQWLKESQRIVFLGFGYIKENLEVLRFAGVKSPKCVGTFYIPSVSDAKAPDKFSDGAQNGFRRPISIFNMGIKDFFLKEPKWTS